MARGFVTPITFGSYSSGSYLRENPDRLKILLAKCHADLPDPEEISDEQLSVADYLTLVREIGDCPAKVGFYEHCFDDGYNHVSDVLFSLRNRDKRINKRAALKFLHEDSASNNEEEALESYFKLR